MNKVRPLYRSRRKYNKEQWLINYCLENSQKMGKSELRKGTLKDISSSPHKKWQSCLSLREGDDDGVAAQFGSSSYKKIPGARK